MRAGLPTRNEGARQCPGTRVSFLVCAVQRVRAESLQRRQDEVVPYLQARARVCRPTECRAVRNLSCRHSDPRLAGAHNLTHNGGTERVAALQKLRYGIQISSRHAQQQTAARLRVRQQRFLSWSRAVPFCEFVRELKSVAATARDTIRCN